MGVDAHSTETTHMMTQAFTNEAIAERRADRVAAILQDEASAPTRFNEKVFILAGRAIFTIASSKTGKHFTFRVSTKEGRDGRPVSFVGLLTGSDNENDYTYLGILNPQTGEVRRTAKSTIGDDAPGFVAIRWTMAAIFAGRELKGAELAHAGRCGRCARLLTDPISVFTGFGPECRGKVGL